VLQNHYLQVLVYFQSKFLEGNVFASDGRTFIMDTLKAMGEPMGKKEFKYLWIETQGDKNLQDIVICYSNYITYHIKLH